MPTIVAWPASRMLVTSSVVRIPPTANTGMLTFSEAAAKSGLFHTAWNGAVRPPHHAPALMVLRRRRVGAARRNRSAMDLLVQKLSGTPPRDSVVSGNTDTSTGVTAS